MAMTLCFKCGGEKIATSTDGFIAQCEACSAREAGGERMPRIVVQPYADRRFVAVTIQRPDGTETQDVLDKGLARMLASALASVT